MPVFEVVGSGDRRSLIKRFERKRKHDAVSELVDFHLLNCTRIEKLEQDLARLNATAAAQDGQVPEPPDRGPWRPITNGLRTVVASDDFTHDVELIVTGDFAEGDKHRYAERLAAWMNAAAPGRGAQHE